MNSTLAKRPTIPTSTEMKIAPAANLPSTMSHIVSGLVSSNSSVPFVFSAAYTPIVMPGIKKRRTTEIEP